MFTIFWQPSFLQLLPGDDVWGEILLIITLLLLLSWCWSGGVKFPKAFSLGSVLTDLPLISTCRYTDQTQNTYSSLKPIYQLACKLNLITKSNILCTELNLEEWFATQTPHTLQNKYRWKSSKCLTKADGEIIASTLFILFSKTNKLKMGGWKRVLSF